MLRKKVEELEENCDILKRKASDLQDKLLAKDQKIYPPGKRESTKVFQLLNQFFILVEHVFILMIMYTGLRS